MVAIDDGFADAKASQMSLMNKFSVVYQDSAIKNTPNFKFNISSFWKRVKEWIATGSSQAKQSIYGQSSKGEEFESKYITDTKKDSYWMGKIMEKYYKTMIEKMAVNHLNKFEDSFVKYEEFFEEWKKKETNRFAELDLCILDQDESLDQSQVNLLMETSDAFKGIAEELAPKFRQIVDRFEELSTKNSKYESDVLNRYEYLAAKVERSFEGQIEGLLDFSDYYRGYARAYDPDLKLSEVFDDVDSLFQNLEAD